MNFSRRTFLKQCGVLGLIGAAPRLLAAATDSGPSKPNIVLIVSDDMGYADLPRFGADKEIPMPNIERLMAGGVTFTDAYASGPICVPSRMGMVTGRHQARWGAYTNVYVGSPVIEFDKEKTLAEFLKPAGYQTALVGKWHLCGNGGPRLSGIAPDKRGYDEVTIIPGGMSSYQPGARLYSTEGKPDRAPEYLTEYFGKQAADFINRKKDGSFFLHLAFNAVHAPLQALDDDKKEFVEVDHADRQTYDAMMRAMDRNIGRVLDALKAADVVDNTLVFFINDNGGPSLTAAKHSYNQASNAPLRGFKFDALEGGVRVPMVLRWPGRVPAGKTYHGITSAMDMAPTILTAVGIPLPTERPMDGVDLRPYLVGNKKDDPHEYLCWFIFFGDPQSAQAAIRRGNRKLWQQCVLKVGPDAAKWELYDLDHDIGETKNLAAEQPDMVRQLDALWRQWYAQMAKA